MYARTENQIKREYARKRNATAQFIKRGYFPDWAEEHRTDPERGLKQYSTPAKWAAYQAGKIDRRKAVELATVRAFREIDQQERKQLEKLRTAENAPDLKYIYISVEWTRSRTWGAIPHAEIRTNNGIYTGTASGCGYDKASTVVAAVFNDCCTGMLWRKRHSRKEKPYGVRFSWRPYFEGGVGVSCYNDICKFIGKGEFKHVAWSDTFDQYEVNFK